MKKLIMLIIFCVTLLLSGCKCDIQEAEKETEIFIVSGTIVYMHHLYSTDIVIETDNGIKVPVYEGRYSNFSTGLEVGDKVSFEVKKTNDTGYEIIGINFENI